MKGVQKPADPKIVVIGGGTGSFVVLSGLKNYTKDLTALVNMADDGGSTGQLRDELGVLPPGDVRQCLVALSSSPRVRDLFNYRFDSGSLRGHALGNLFLTALEKMTGSFAQAIDLAEEVLRVNGHVVPITLDSVTLSLDDGLHRRDGQFAIAHKPLHQPRPRVWLEPKPTINPVADQAIIQADLVVIAPGNLYGSLAPTLVVPGVGAALRQTPATVVYVCNLVTKPGQTDNFAVHDFVAEIERLAGGEIIDLVLYNDNPPREELIKRYASEGELPVTVDHLALADKPYISRSADLLANSIWRGGQKADSIAKKRTLIRHDPIKVARQLMMLVGR